MRTVAVVSVIMAGVMAPAVASAHMWTKNGVTPWSGLAHSWGSLTVTMNANNVQTSCDVNSVMDLHNFGMSPFGQASGSVTSFSLSNCSTTAPGCNVTATANALPWLIDTWGTSVAITGFSVTFNYSGITCALAGLGVTFSGNVTGGSSASTVEFVGATGLSSPVVGPATLDGTIESEDETTGDPVGMMP